MNTPWSGSEHNPTLRSHDFTFVPVPTSQDELNKAWVPNDPKPSNQKWRSPNDLSSAKFVFVRHDAHRGLLKPPYDGPFKVLESTDKTFITDVGGRSECVSTEHLKPAHRDLDQPTEVAMAHSSVNKSGQLPVAGDLYKSGMQNLHPWWTGYVDL